MASYNKEPFVEIEGWEHAAWDGYDCIAHELLRKLNSLQGKSDRVLAVECYPGVRIDEIVNALSPVLQPARIIYAEHAAKERLRIDRMLSRYLTEDRVFGYMAPFTVQDFYDADRLRHMQQQLLSDRAGLTMIIGTGAALVAEADVTVYADLTRWEIQQRYRSQEIGNWLASNHGEDILRKYKRGFFVEWRAADRFKRSIMHQCDYYLDTNTKNDPKMITVEALMDGLKQTSRRPFRLVPYFDPGVWGGRWLEEHIGLSPQEHPYAWGFDGVPEENSVYFRYGSIRVEIPSMNIVFFEPAALLGESVYSRFGAEFPIRFDFLDTIGGQHLSLQVHPSTDYIRNNFGMSYTQDESYYILAAEEGASVYLGLKESVDREQMLEELEKAQQGGHSFPADAYVNRLPAHKHDHFLIPAGTVHCSCSGTMVLEISSTPYIFTFKLWDWDRLGLDGKPRPVHLKHGMSNIRWDRTTKWVEEQLVNPVTTVDEQSGWKEERTGLHPLQFIETRRHWFTEPVRHPGLDSVQMLNLVEGEQVVVESPTNAFPPFKVGYAETFIIPAAAGAYTIRPSTSGDGKPYATIKAYVRT
ncbi:class I mannose-6-phosphate isomerase [Paenibacillus allorhizosphaerae]|uniref:Mannose-6-phosphate isomerase n=1 Tax=Paenibacillus allorhizosphaerae TaxID=2849866 RepID=A0ABM8VAD9_9BACL|nr:class I mannose-6-phosphate isomerase [Paenibacillus allorhizosphaerae]CAG7616212.1 hypothetical protein PAECIP111802_00261 [Paenibacillus allorhizosphaerae]